MANADEPTLDLLDTLLSSISHARAHMHTNRRGGYGTQTSAFYPNPAPGTPRKSEPCRSEIPSDFRERIRKQERGYIGVGLADVMHQHAAGRGGDDIPNDDELFIQVSLTPSDTRARGLLRAFEAEVDAWMKTSGDKPLRREAFANFLASKFLCTGLDGLPRSPTVTGITRKVAKCIEDISEGRAVSLVVAMPATIPIASRRVSTATGKELVAVATSKQRRHWCTVEIGDWSCRLCTKKNYVEDAACAVCGRLKPPPRGPLTPPVLEPPKHIGKDDTLSFTEDERRKNIQMEAIQTDYREFYKSKLRLDK